MLLIGDLDRLRVSKSYMSEPNLAPDELMTCSFSAKLSA